MLDRYLHPPLKPALARLAAGLDRRRVRADHLTLFGFTIGALAVPLLMWQQHGAALAAVLINRLCDGLDGALARRQGLSDAGGFLDISLDFLFYALLPLGFVLADPAQNALPGAWLLCAFIGTGSSFLAFAALAQKHRLQALAYPHKSFYYLGGLTEGTETILLFIAFCLWPSLFAPLAWLFGALCWFTTLTRVWGGYHTLRRVAQDDAAQRE
ncbi:CDP-alcohol phosphatidyltransferase family protein [Edwardsiella piscicida]|uniref:CDP-alcohol phosphatidyltransferase family protein n=1 Tax=Edwardsiella piscicida TaxID=1263550 RepID=UPI00101AC140|nr:CDP-alcohol phosphatidyltransferase family protein [Edwardsiella piscicida]QBB13400.1 CDP-alcohol phosphatidyltransferase family protein [Edwardsiella piscicida]